MQDFIDVINSIDSNFPKVNPTVIYNEGWMTRILVNQSIKEKTILKGLDFGRIANWTSEALISSPFISADKSREGYTHADIALGDFKVNYESRGEILILDNAKIFGIIEAKMSSSLSRGTKNAVNYNQASRNLVCMASLTYNKDCDIFFSVVAPETKLKEHDIDKQIDLENMIQQIKSRFVEYSDEFKSNRKMDLIISKARTCKVWSMSYEEWIESLIDAKSKVYLKEFYMKAKKWNRLR